MILRESDDNEHFYCIVCMADIIPFTSQTKHEFYICMFKDFNFQLETSNIEFNSLSQEKYFNKLNTYVNDKFNSIQNDDNENDDEEPSINCQYYDIDDFTKAKFNPPKKLLNFTFKHSFSPKTYRRAENYTKITQLQI